MYSQLQTSINFTRPLLFHSTFTLTMCHMNSSYNKSLKIGNMYCNAKIYSHLILTVNNQILAYSKMVSFMNVVHKQLLFTIPGIAIYVIAYS